MQFVVNAVRADSADPVAPRELSPGRWDLLLPPAWHGGLDEVPGVYKDIHQVMAAQQDLVETLAEFHPRLVKMAPPGERAED